MSEYSIIIEVKGDGSNGIGSYGGNAGGSSSSSGVGGGAGGSGSGGGGSSSTSKLVQGSSGSSLSQLKKAVAATGAVAMGNKILSYKTSRVYTETGNRQWQDNINAAKQVGGQIASVVGGFVAGGVVGGIVAMGGIALDYALKYDSYQFARQMEAKTLYINQQRAGIGGMALSRSRAFNQ